METEFTIPLNRNDLFDESNDGQYHVTEKIGCNELSQAIIGLVLIFSPSSSLTDF